MAEAFGAFRSSLTINCTVANMERLMLVERK